MNLDTNNNTLKINNHFIEMLHKILILCIKHLFMNIKMKIKFKYNFKDLTGTNLLILEKLKLMKINSSQKKFKLKISSELKKYLKKICKFLKDKLSSGLLQDKILTRRNNKRCKIIEM
jgi:hypothetical protein